MENLEKIKSKAEELLREFKGESYIFGLNCVNKAGELASRIGLRAVLIISSSNWAEKFKDMLLKSLGLYKISIIETVDTVRPNCPREDLYRIQDVIVKNKPDFIIAAGGGSTIDCAKAASVLAIFSPNIHNIEPYFGTGTVTREIIKSGRKPLPLFAVQMSASSAAHLTKYSNITDLGTYQKKLIVDDAIIPPISLFDYSITSSMSRDLTTDGALDGISHLLEVYYGANYDLNPQMFKKIEEITIIGLKLLVKNLHAVLKNGGDLKKRELIALGTDLGGYAIMLGGTNGAHLSSFSFVDILSHGRACGIMNPYYTVFFAPAIRRQLFKIIDIFSDYIEMDPDIKTASLKTIPVTKHLSYEIAKFTSRQLGEIAALAMLNFLKIAGIPTRLSDVKGFKQEHIDKAIKSAKNPQVEMKLKNMPVVLDASVIDKYMLPVLESAKTGDFSLIKNFG